MKITLTVSQIKKLLQDHPIHLPITIIMKGIDREELKEIIKLLNKKKS